MNIYVGNIAHRSTEQGIEELFSQYGQVASVKIVKDRFTNEPRGFAFVEMPNDDEAKAAIDALNGTNFDGRDLRINEARPREANGGAGNGGGSRFGGPRRPSNGGSNGGSSNGGGSRFPRY